MGGRQPDDRCVKRWRMDYREPARRYLLSDSFFLSKLRNYDEELAPAQFAKINKYFQDPAFTEERVQQCSRAAHELYLWVQVLLQRQRQQLQEKKSRRLSMEALQSPEDASSFATTAMVDTPTDTISNGRTSLGGLGG